MNGKENPINIKYVDSSEIKSPTILTLHKIVGVISVSNALDRAVAMCKQTNSSSIRQSLEQREKVKKKRLERS